MSGLRPGAMPASPSYKGRATNSAGVSITVASGVTTRHCSAAAVDELVWAIFTRELAMRARLRLAAKLFLLFLPLGLGLFDRADVHERVLREVVPFALANLFEAADRFGQRRDLARFAGEHLSHKERL